MIAQGCLHFINPGIMAAEVFTNFFVLFGAVGFPALHLDDELIDRLFQGNHTHVKLVQKKPDDRNCDYFDAVSYTHLTLPTKRIV